MFEFLAECFPFEMFATMQLAQIYEKIEKKMKVWSQQLLTPNVWLCPGTTDISLKGNIHHFGFKSPGLESQLSHSLSLCKLRQERVILMPVSQVKKLRLIEIKRLNHSFLKSQIQTK